MFDRSERPGDDRQQCPTARELRSLVCRAAARVDPDTIAPADVVGLLQEWTAIAHAAGAVQLLLGARAATGDTWRAAGTRNAGEWLASKTGTTTSKAKEDLATARRMRDLPDTTDAAKRGELSPSQAAAIAGAAEADPGAEQTLLGAAGRESLGELRDRCDRTKAAADNDPDATRRRIHEARRLKRYRTSDGLHHLLASGPADALAGIDAAMRPFLEAAFTADRTAGMRETFEARAFDALVAMARAAGHPAPPAPAPSAPPPAPAPEPGLDGDGPDPDPDRGGSPPGPATPPEPAPAQPRNDPRYRIILRADLAALVRGHLVTGEVCEIPGVGPVPVTEVRDLLGDATLHLVLTKGNAVANVTHLGRGPTAAQRIALLWQAPRCTRVGCPHKARLENDHRTPWADIHTTRLDNLDPLCGHDHDLKTYKGWALVTGTGPRPMVPPGHPDHPRTGGAGDAPHHEHRSRSSTDNADREPANVAWLEPATQ